ncbi:hypothetical protein P9112_001791 [Eukaryota sp. TZLM1-RC]
MRFSSYLSTPLDVPRLSQKTELFQDSEAFLLLLNFIKVDKSYADRSIHEQINLTFSWLSSHVLSNIPSSDRPYIFYSFLKTILSVSFLPHPDISHHIHSFLHHSFSIQLDPTYLSSLTSLCDPILAFFHSIHHLISPHIIPLFASYPLLHHLSHSHLDHHTPKPITQSARSIITNQVKQFLSDSPSEVLDDVISSIFKTLEQSNLENIQDSLFSLLGPEAFDLMISIISLRDQFLMEMAKAQATSSKSHVIQATPRHDDIADHVYSTRAIESFSSATHPERSLRAGTQVTQFKDYEEVKLPGPKKKSNTGLGLGLDKLNPNVRGIFGHIKKFNPVQTQIFDSCYNSNVNMLICAPTGAGKTNIALLAMAKEIEKHMNSQGNLINKSNWKIIYLAPMKALASEVVGKMKTSLSVLGLTVREVTGDTNLTREQIEDCQLIVATPEKWDVITRKSQDSVLVSQTKLIVIDEIHLLAEDRGSCLEALVARTLRLVELTQEGIRVVGLSATLPNFQDVAEFLRVPSSGVFYFDPSFRPVPLTQYFVGVKKPMKGKPPTRRDQDDKSKGDQQKIKKVTGPNIGDMLNLAVFDYVKRSLSAHQQAIVFVHSRNDTVKTANFVLSELRSNQLMGLLDYENSHSREFSKSISKIRSSDVGQLCQNRIGAHHAGLLRSDRHTVENLFSKGELRLIFCTSTLAWGVNLPAHWVIIKGTQIYSPAKGGFADISILDIHQCFGRAGRPGLDTSGEAVLITEQPRVDDFLRLVSMKNPIESKLIKMLPEHLNAEIVLGSISSIREAVQWLRFTFLHVRMKKNPLAYGVDWHVLENDPELYTRRFQLIVDAARRLSECRMIMFNESAESFSITDTGRIASHFYLNTGTIEILNEKLRDEMSLGEILEVLASLPDFEQMQVRDDEIPELEKLRSTSCAVAVNNPVTTVEGKANVLIQSWLSNRRPISFSLVADYNYISQNLGRIVRGIFELTIRRGLPTLCSAMLTFSIAVQSQLWPWSSPLWQFNIPKEIVYRLDQSNFDIADLFDMTDEEIAGLCRTKGAVKSIRNALNQLPYLQLTTKLLPLTNSVAKFTVSYSINFDWSRVHGNSQNYWLLVESETTNELLYSEYLTVKRQQLNNLIDCTFVIPISDPRPTHVTTRLISDSFLGVESHHILPLVDVVFPSSESHYTTLLPLVPLKVSVLPQKFRKLFKFSHFNPIQTQIFHTAYHTDQNILVGAPTGSGKTLVAELAILRLIDMLKSNLPNLGKVVFVAPLKALVFERFNDWKAKFSCFGNVVALTGESNVDSFVINSASIVITTPEKFDSLSRGWKVRKFISQISLLIMDEIHTLGSERGAVTEAIVQRMKMVSQEFQRPIRFLALSTHLANVSDLSTWLDVPTSCVFNFHPSVRPVPVEVRLSSFPGPRHYCPRMKTMNKPIYSFLNSLPRLKPAIVFVSSRRQTRLTAYDLISFCISDDATSRFIGQHESSRDLIDSAIMSVSDPHLKDTLSFGIGLHHAGLSHNDRHTVENLFCSGHLLLLVSTSTLAYGINTPAFACVIKGTEFFDAKQARYVQYPLVDVLQMIGRAGRPGYDTEAVAMVMVHEPVRFFYKRFLYEAFPIESSFAIAYIEHLNAEIAAGTVQTKAEMIQWMKQMFWYKRIVQNPDFYDLESHDDVEKHLEIMIESGISSLIDANCANTISKDDSLSITSTVYGKIACFYYVSYKSLSLWQSDLSFDQADTCQLLFLISSSHEFSELPVRHNEDLLNQELSKSVRFRPEYLDFSSPFTKTFLLLQCYIDFIKLPISDYDTDLKLVLDNVMRVVNALIDFSLHKKYLLPTLKLINLLQSIKSRHWFDKVNLDMLHSELADKLVSIGVTHLPLAVTVIHESPQILSGISPNLMVELSKIPLLNVEIQKKEGKVDVKISNICHSGKGSGKDQSVFILLGQGKQCLDFKKFNLGRKEVRITLTFDGDFEPDFVYLLHDSFVQMDLQYQI